MDSSPQFQPITEEDIAYFLVNTPDFFERHADLLTGVQLSSPHSGRAISLQERQAELLRRKIHDLELRVAGMLRLGQDNVAIADRLLGWTQALLRARVDPDLPDLLEAELKARFRLTQVALRLWGLAPEFAGLDQSHGAGEPARAYAAVLEQPYCGANAGQEPVAWLDQPEAAASVALLPLRVEAGAAPFGLLVLASSDPLRFQPSMDTDFLRHLGELAAAALSRLLPDNSAP